MFVKTKDDTLTLLDMTWFSNDYLRNNSEQALTATLSEMFDSLIKETK